MASALPDFLFTKCTKEDILPVVPQYPFDPARDDDDDGGDEIFQSLSNDPSEKIFPFCVANITKILSLPRLSVGTLFSIFKMRVRENIFKNNIYMYILFLFALLRSS